MVWRAGGIAVLLVFQQDLGPRASSQEHELAIRPPAGWSRRPGNGPVVVRYFQPGDAKHPADLTVSHMSSGNPTPVPSWKKQARDYIADKYKGSTILEEKDLELAGKPGFRIVFTHDGIRHLKTVVLRSNLEYYLLDGSMEDAQAAQIQPLLERSIGSFEIVPRPDSEDEKAAHEKLRSFLAESKVRKELLGERWYSIFLGTRKVGHMRVKLSEDQGLYAFEADVKNDFGEGQKDQTQARGTFSPDGKTQRVDSEQTKDNGKERWRFRASLALAAGRLAAQRDMNGIKEEKTFPVPEGVLLTDVAEFVRPSLALAGKGRYLMRVLSGYSEEPQPELVEVGGREHLEVDGKFRDCILLQSEVDRRKNLLYYLSPEGAMLRMGGPRELFSIKAASKDEALK
jgi:hypothetical protein